MLCLSENYQTTQNIKAREAFTISFADAAHVKAADYVGLVSVKEAADKMEKAGFHTTKSEFVDAPLIDELPMALECKFIKVNEDGNIIGEIINVNADEKILGSGGVIDMAKLDAISFDPVNNVYVRMGEKVGNAFSDGAELYYISVDVDGEIGWEAGIFRNKGRALAHVIEILTASTQAAYKAYLRKTGVSYIIAGEKKLDCA